MLQLNGSQDEYGAAILIVVSAIWAIGIGMAWIWSGWH